MDTTTQARMDAKFRESAYYTNLSLAGGVCVDEGDSERLPVVERSIDSALYVARNPLGTEAGLGVLRNLANTRDAALQKLIADQFLDKPKERGTVVILSDLDARHLSAEQFMQDVRAGAAELVICGWPRHRYPELEWMRRQAEVESGWKRTNTAEKSVGELAFDAAFGAMKARYYRALRKQRMTTKVTPTLPT